MCGIVGIVRNDGHEIDRAIIKRMADSLVHRGPDEEGFYFNHPRAMDHEPHTLSFELPASSYKVGLAHRRLSIIDLASGQQPLCNEDGTIWVVFNGEIYNFLDLKKELQDLGHKFRTNSDTETIVHAYEEWGTECLSRLGGMFAFAIWDEGVGRLFLARDRIGKKPLYYYHGKDVFLFGSELKAILQYPGIKRQIDYTALTDYLKYLYVPDPKTIYQDIFKLPPAHYLLFELGKSTVKAYWDITFNAINTSNEADLTDQLFDLLRNSVKERLIAEVPLGAFLSGGIDSSGVVALMARLSDGPVRTCTIGFEDAEHDESPFAREVAQILDTDHREFFVREDITDVVQKLPSFFDEPFADSSAVPTYYVCKMARQAVTVALSGDGGDESFGGYHKYVLDYYENLLGRIIPSPILKLINKLSVGRFSVCRRARTLTANAIKDPARAYYETNTFITDEDLDSLLAPKVKDVLKGYDPFDYTKKFFKQVETDDHLTRLLYTDLKTYLPGDILVKVDRMSMANSLEVRSPILDHKVIEFAAGLPSCLKIRGRDKKYILKKVFGRLLPSEIFNRPKHGFTVPLDRWFRHELKGLSEQALLRSEKLDDLLNIAMVKRTWEQHQSGRHNNGTLLWSILMLALWYESQQ